MACFRRDTLALKPLVQPIAYFAAFIVLVESDHSDRTHQLFTNCDKGGKAGAVCIVLLAFFDELLRIFQACSGINPRQPFPKVVPLAVNSIKNSGCKFGTGKVKAYVFVYLDKGFKLHVNRRVV